MIAVRPERHTLLTDAEWHVPRDAGAHRRLTRGVLPGTGGQHLADEHRVDGVRRDAALLERAADRDAAELHGGERRELALESPLRRARGGDDDDVVVVHASTLSSTEPTCSGTISAGSVAATTSSTVTPGRELDEHEPVVRHIDDGEVGDDAVDDAACR